MNRAFVVLVELDDASDDTGVSQDIIDLLFDGGFDVISVNPHGGDAPTVTAIGEEAPSQSQLKF